MLKIFILLLLMVPAVAQNMPPVNGDLTGCAIGKKLLYTATNTLGCSTGTPNVVICGTNPSVVGSSLEGTITAGSGTLTACGLNFGRTLSAIPRCNVTGSIGAVWISAKSTTGISINAASLTSSKIDYNCWGAF